MKQFYALTAIAVFFNVHSSAQFIQNFEPINSLTTGCNLTVNSDRTDVGTEVITGTGSLFSNPPVNGSGTRDYATPYLNVADALDPSATTTLLTISFNYKLNEELNGQAVRNIQIGLQSPSGFINLSTINMDKNNDPVTATSFSNSFDVPTGVYRLVLKMGGNQGNGTVRIIIDDVLVSANPYYTLGGTCNLAPIVTNDVFFTSNLTTPTLFSSVLDNDVEPNNEMMSTPTVSVVSPDGTVVFNPDGSFVFTPYAGFTGTSTTFTYTIFDKGYDAMAATGLVTINFSSGSILPVRLISFNGSMVNNRPLLNWTVVNNEDATKMEVEKSSDSRNFTTATVVLPSSQKDEANYVFSDGNITAPRSYYRLKITSKNNTVSYSGVLMMTTGTTTANAPILLENPVRNTLRFNLTALLNTSLTVNIYDLAGRKMISQKLMVQKGVNNIAIVLNERLAAGSYLVETLTGGDRTVSKLIKQ